MVSGFLECIDLSCHLHQVVGLLLDEARFRLQFIFEQGQLLAARAFTGVLANRGQRACALLLQLSLQQLNFGDEAVDRRSML